MACGDELLTFSDDRSVTITVNGNSKSPARSFDNFWVWNYASETGGEISGNIQLRIEAWDGQVITDSVGSLRSSCLHSPGD